MRNNTININSSNTFAFFALLISICSIYLSVFYRDHKLSVSLVDSKVKLYGNNLNVKLLYYNQGNTYSTIIQDYLVFYQNNNWENNGIMFNKGTQVYEMEYNPIILVPGEQSLRDLDVESNFSQIVQTNWNLNDTIYVGFVTKYINQSGSMTGDMFKLGYILLNGVREITKYKMEYKIFELKGDHYYSSKTEYTN